MWSGCDSWERCPCDLTWKLLFSIPAPCFHFSLTPFHLFVLPPPITSWGREGWGRLSVLMAQRATPPTGHPGGNGRGTPGLEPAWRRPRQQKGSWLAGPALPLDARVPPLPAQQPSAPAPAWNMTFWNLWVEMQLHGL